MGEKILVHTDSMFQQHLHGLVGAVQKARIGVHVQKPIEVLGVVVLHASDVIVKKLVTLCNVLFSEFREINNAKQTSSSNRVPVLTYLIVHRAVQEVRDHVEKPLVLVRSYQHLNVFVELPGLQEILRTSRKEWRRCEGGVWHGLRKRD